MRKWWEPSQSTEIEAKPWLAPRVIEKLTEIVKPHFRVIEHGCGGSTLWFSERAKETLSFDGNKQWRETINQKVDQNKARVFSELGTLDNNQLVDKFDLLLIDGMPLEERKTWLDKAPEIVKSGGWVVLDNANRPQYAAERKTLQEQAASFETFDGNEGGTQYLVTEFYRLK